MDSDVRFGVLGPVEVRVGPRDSTPSRARLRELLALLLVRAGRPVRSSVLITELYGERPPETASTALQVHVSQLRKALVTAGDRPRRLVTVPAGYLLRIEPDELDLYRFEHLATLGGRLLDDGAAVRAAAVLRDALGVWRGPALADAVSPSLVEVHGPRAEARRLEVLEMRIRADLAAGAGSSLVPELRNLVAAHPLREELRTHLVLALYQGGQQADALSELAAYRALLAAEVGVRPGPRIAALQRRILDGDPQLRPRPRVVAAPVPSAVAPAQLPPCPALIGRRTESAALLAAFEEPAPVALAVGGAGTGTTALVVSVAHRVRDRFPDGQFFAQVGALSAAEVLGSFLRSLGVAPGDLAPDPAGRAARLTAELAGRRVLVVLDDVPAGWGAAALTRLPVGSALLMSSPGRLPELGGRVRRVPVGPLDRAAALALLATVLGEARVAAEPAAAAEVVEWCGRLPLALRTIAARAAGRPHWTLRAVAARLASPAGLLAELVAGDLCMRESLMRRYQACDEDQRAAFRRLARLGDDPGPVGERPAAGSAVADRTAVAVLAGTGLLDVAEVAAGAAGYRMSTVCAALAVELFGPAAGGSAAERVGGQLAEAGGPGAGGSAVGGYGATGHGASSSVGAGLPVPNMGNGAKAGLNGPDLSSLLL
jgi:DNA-binding SARP family transcriptional activator